MGVEKYRNNFELTVHEDTLRIPYTWTKGKMVFVNSMSDLFHEEIPLEFIQKVFEVMRDNPQHVFQVLTKRADILYKYSKSLFWPHNIWMGMSIENEKVVDRIDFLRQTDARVKFLSCEPLLSEIPNMDLSNIDWIIVGGESGRKPRPMKKQWVESIKLQCEMADVAFYFKQWGGINKKKSGRELDGRIYDEMPIIEEHS